MDMNSLSYREVLLELRKLEDVWSRRESWDEEDKVTYGLICQRFKQYGIKEEEESVTK